VSINRARSSVKAALLGQGSATACRWIFERSIALVIGVQCISYGDSFPGISQTGTPGT